MYELVALLPMKAHSERVKNKNFKDLCGKPLYRWILDNLLNSSEIDLIVINTDAELLLNNKELLNNKRILLRERPEEIRGDFVSMNKVLEDDVKNISSKWYLMTHTTNPLLKIKTIKEAISKIKSNTKNDSLFSVTKFQTRFYRADGSAVNHDPNVLLRTQDLEPWYEENSNLYLFSRESFLKNNSRIGHTPFLFEMNKTEAIDIDEPEDWEQAVALIEYNLRKKNDL